MTVGERLREARERQKVSLQVIAERTNVSVRFLEAIEKNQFEKLPGGIFTRGFIRSYATHVGLDPDAVVAQYLADRPEEVDSIEEERAPRVNEDLAWGVGAVVVGAVIVIGGGLAWVFVPDWFGRGTPQKEAAAQAAPDPYSTAPVADAPSAEPASPAQVPEAPAAQATPPSPVDAPAATSTAPLRLVVAPTGRCWVQVSSDGRVRIARELAPGERQTIEATERLQIIAGDAGAFAYEINGRPGRSLGGPGVVARATILPTNASQFQVP